MTLPFRRRAVLLVLCIFGVFGYSAEPISQTTMIITAPGETPSNPPGGTNVVTTIPAVLGVSVVDRSVTIKLGPPIFGIVPNPVTAPTTVVAGTRVTFMAVVANDAGASFTWYKDGRQIPGEGRTLEVVMSSGADSGRYSAIVSNRGNVIGTDSARVLVTGREGPRMLNLSVLGQISAEQPVLVSGFQIETGGAGANTLVLIRAVGPGLTAFGIDGFLSAPHFHLLDAAGAVLQPVNIPFAFPTVAAASARTGAFALPANSTDVAQLYYLKGSGYSAHISSADGSSGVVLFEVFEVPL